MCSHYQKQSTGYLNWLSLKAGAWRSQHHAYWHWQKQNKASECKEWADVVLWEVAVDDGYADTTEIAI